MRVYLKLLGCTLLAEPAMMATPAYGMDGTSLQKTLKDDAGRYEESDHSLEALAAASPFLSYGEWKKTNHRRHELRTLWSGFFAKYDFLICPIFSRSAFEHDHSGTNLLPFWRETGRSMDIDGTKTKYQRHVFWSAPTGTCFLPSTAIIIGDDGAPTCAQTTATSSTSTTTPSSHEQQDEFQMLNQGVWEDPHNEDKEDEEPFTYHLVQADETGSDEYVVVHSVCLDHLKEEDGDHRIRRALSWRQSMDFLETLLGPAAAQNVIEVDWKPGDMVVFDNLRLMHSVTPTKAYDDTQGQRRLMTRTAMQPTTRTLVT